MTFEVQPEQVRSAWSQGAGRADGSLASSGGDRTTARGSDLEELTGALSAAADVLDGVTSTSLAVLDELHGALEASLTSYAQTDDAAALTFPVLTPPVEGP